MAKARTMLAMHKLQFTISMLHACNTDGPPSVWLRAAQNVGSNNLPCCYAIEAKGYTQMHTYTYTPGSSMHANELNANNQPSSGKTNSREDLKEAFES